jgi:hypothetical protein
MPVSPIQESADDCETLRREMCRDLDVQLERARERDKRSSCPRCVKKDGVRRVRRWLTNGA